MKFWKKNHENGLKTCHLKSNFSLNARESGGGGKEGYSFHGLYDYLLMSLPDVTAKVIDADILVTVRAPCLLPQVDTLQVINQSINRSIILNIN